MHDADKPVKAPSTGDPKRILVIGRAGAGKTTVARSLAASLGLPLVHLDRLAWNPGWQLVPSRLFANRETAAIEGDAWVLDGGYLSSPGWPARLARADVVLLVESPLPLCLWRIVRRAVRPSPTRRPDLPDGCEEHLSLAFVGWTSLWSLRTRGQRRAARAKMVRVSGWCGLRRRRVP